MSLGYSKSRNSTDFHKVIHCVGGKCAGHSLIFVSCISICKHLRKTKTERKEKEREKKKERERKEGRKEERRKKKEGEGEKERKKRREEKNKKHDKNILVVVVKHFAFKIAYSFGWWL